MAFSNRVPDLSFGGFDKLLGNLGSTIAKSTKAIIGRGALNMSKKWVKVFGKGMKKGALALGDDVFMGLTKGLQTLASGGLNVLGVMLQFADSLGILQPIFSLITGVMQMIGGAAMEGLAPALKTLATVLFSPEMQANFKSFGLLVGQFVGTIMGMISTVLSDPEFMKVIKVFGQIIGNIFGVLTGILGWFFDILGVMSPQQIGLLFYALGIGLAFMVGLLSGGPIGPILGAVFAGIAAIALSPLLFLAEGGYVPPSPGGTLAVIGEGNEGEYVVPESKMGNIGGSEEVVWATQDNGDKLDKIINILGSQGRLR